MLEARSLIRLLLTEAPELGAEKIGALTKSILALAAPAPVLPPAAKEISRVPGRGTVVTLMVGGVPIQMDWTAAVEAGLV